MVISFRNLVECLDFFKEEGTCREFLEEQRWGSTPACPFCGVINPYRTNRGFKCREKLCGKKFSVTVGTVYENTKIPLRIWFAAIYLCTSSKKGISSLQAGRQLGITQKSAWFMMHRIRKMLEEKAPYMLKNVVQMDEAYVGGLEKNKHKNKRIRKGTDKVKKGRSEAKTPVFGIIEMGGKVIVKVTNFISKKKVKQLIEKHVEVDSTIVTDGYLMYKFLSKDSRFKHMTVNHQKGEYKRNGFHTNNIENFWSILKRGIIGIYHYVSYQHLQRYCDEFSARYNSRTMPDPQRFKMVFRNVSIRLTYNELIGKP